MADFKSTVVDGPLTVKAKKISFQNIRGVANPSTVENVLQRAESYDSSFPTIAPNLQKTYFFLNSLTSSVSQTNNLYIYSSSHSGPKLTFRTSSAFVVNDFRAGFSFTKNNSSDLNALLFYDANTNSSAPTGIQARLVDSSNGEVSPFIFNTSEIKFLGSDISIDRDLRIILNGSTQGTNIYMPTKGTVSPAVTNSREETYAGGTVKFGRYGLAVLGGNSTYGSTSSALNTDLGPWSGLILTNCKNNSGGIFLYNNRQVAAKDVWQIYISPTAGTTAPTYQENSLMFRRSANLGSMQRIAYINSDHAFDNMNFTGQHRLHAEDNIHDKIGYIVVSLGKYSNLDNTDITINESLPIVCLSEKRNQKNCIGVISNSEDFDADTRQYNIGIFGSFYKKEVGESRLYVNSLGEGAIWICNINGDLENGDYITTCEIPGLGMRQDLQTKTNYTVAKITCDCDFDLASSIYKCEEFQWQGQTYRKAFVGCTYHCG